MKLKLSNFNLNPVKTQVKEISISSTSNLIRLALYHLRMKIRADVISIFDVEWHHDKEIVLEVDLPEELTEWLELVGLNFDDAANFAIQLFISDLIDAGRVKPYNPLKSEQLVWPESGTYVYKDGKRYLISDYIDFARKNKIPQVRLYRLIKGLSNRAAGFTLKKIVRSESNV